MNFYKMRVQLWQITVMYDSYVFATVVVQIQPLCNAVIFLAQGPTLKTLSEYERIEDQSNNDIGGVQKSRLIRTRAVYEQFYGSVQPNPEESALNRPYNSSGLSTVKPWQGSSEFPNDYETG